MTQVIYFNGMSISVNEKTKAHDVDILLIPPFVILHNLLQVISCLSYLHSTITVILIMADPCELIASHV